MSVMHYGHILHVFTLWVLFCRFRNALRTLQNKTCNVRNALRTLLFVDSVMQYYHYGTITEPLRTLCHRVVFVVLCGHFMLYIDKNWHGDLVVLNLLPSLFLMKSEH